jgi:hypothetical protein
MTNIFLFILGFFYIVVSVLMCIQESNNRKINFVLALILCIAITPFFAYFVFGILPARNPRGCNWCGNKKNEAEYCGLCGKNEKRDLRPNFLKH